MFGHFDPHRRNVEYLALFIPRCGQPRQVGLTMGTSRDRIALNLIGFGDHLQGVTLVAWLPAQRSLPWLAQTAGAWLLQSIATRWLAAVMAIFGQLVAQHLDQHALSSQLLLQRQQQANQAGFVQLLQLVLVETNRLCHAL